MDLIHGTYIYIHTHTCTYTYTYAHTYTCTHSYMTVYMITCTALPAVKNSSTTKRVVKNVTQSRCNMR